MSNNEHPQRKQLLCLGLAGKSPFEEALVDAYADWFKDFNFEVAEFLRVLVKIAEGDKVSPQYTEIRQ